MRQVTLRYNLRFAYPTLLFSYKLEALTKFVFSDFLISLVTYLTYSDPRAKGVGDLNFGQSVAPSLVRLDLLHPKAPSKKYGRAIAPENSLRNTYGSNLRANLALMVFSSQISPFGHLIPIARPPRRIASLAHIRASRSVVRELWLQVPWANN